MGLENCAQVQFQFSAVIPELLRLIWVQVSPKKAILQWPRTPTNWESPGRRSISFLADGTPSAKSLDSHTCHSEASTCGSEAAIQRSGSCQVMLSHCLAKKNVTLKWQSVTFQSNPGINSQFYGQSCFWIILKIYRTWGFCTFLSCALGLPPAISKSQTSMTSSSSGGSLQIFRRFWMGLDDDPNLP